MFLWILIRPSRCSQIRNLPCRNYEWRLTFSKFGFGHETLKKKCDNAAIDNVFAHELYLSVHRQPTSRTDGIPTLGSAPPNRRLAAFPYRKPAVCPCTSNIIFRPLKHALVRSHSRYGDLLPIQRYNM